MIATSNQGLINFHVKELGSKGCGCGRREDVQAHAHPHPRLVTWLRSFNCYNKLLVALFENNGKILNLLLEMTILQSFIIDHFRNSALKIRLPISVNTSIFSLYFILLEYWIHLQAIYFVLCINYFSYLGCKESCFTS